jgi:hypothetical protein
MLGASWLAFAVGVGNKPPSRSTMRGTHVGGIETAIARRVTECVKVLCCCLDGVLRDVFGEDVSGLAFADDSAHLGPEVFCAGEAMGGGAKRLARETTTDDVDESSPGLGIEFRDITKDRKPGEAAVVLPRREDLLAMGVEFNGADGLVSEKCVGKYPPANACK